MSSDCVTVDQSSYSTYIGQCLYYHGIYGYSVTLPNTPHDLEEFMCGKHFNRTGTLCGKCKDGHYPLAYSFDMNCVECPNGKSNWWKFVLAAFLPLTIFYFIVVLFKINITSSHLQGFVFCLSRHRYACTGTSTPYRYYIQSKYSKFFEVYWILI